MGWRLCASQVVSLYLCIVVNCVLLFFVRESDSEVVYLTVALKQMVTMILKVTVTVMGVMRLASCGFMGLPLWL